MTNKYERDPRQEAEAIDKLSTGEVRRFLSGNDAQVVARGHVNIERVSATVLGKEVVVNSVHGYINILRSI